MTLIEDMAGEIEQMLINLNSPEKVNNIPCQQTYLKNPLIPGPDVNCNIECNNPFDIVANSAENWDPFELVLLESLKKVENACYKNSKTPSSKVDKTNKILKSSSPIHKNGFVNEFCGKQRKIFRSHSVTENMKYFRSPTKHSSKSDTDSPPHSPEGAFSPNWSLAEKIKKVVKSRVSKCIEKALNGSVSQPDLSKADSSSPIKTYNNTFSKITGVCPELNFMHKNFSSSNSCYQYKRMSGSASHNKSLNAGDYSKEELNDIFYEAKNISVALKNMSTFSSPIKEAPLGTDYVLRNNAEEDLMSVQPPWDDNSDVSFSSESDDSSIGLPKVKLYYLKKKEKKRNEITPADLEQYKRRIRASIDGNISCDEGSPANKTEELVRADEISNIVLAESLMEEKNKIKEKDQVMKEILPVAIPSLPEVNDLRPKKRGNILKKGPLKAIVPLQKMTKTITDKISPMRKNTTSSSSKTLNKSKEEHSFSASVLQPVASSTPNRKVFLNVNTPEAVSKARPRVSRRDNQPETKAKVSSFRRSTSLTSDSRSTNPKLPFSTVNQNVKQSPGHYINRPHTAPSKTNSFARNSPISKDSLRKYVKQTTANDKENRLQAV